MKLMAPTAPSSPKGGIKECFLSKDTNLVSSPPQADGGALHHTFFTYPHKPKPNPALSTFLKSWKK